jgi:hypothetical protein
MTNKGKKMEPPLKLDMSFAEALGRFVRTDPKEVDESVERSKTKKPPQDNSLRQPRRSGRQTNET